MSIREISYLSLIAILFCATTTAHAQTIPADEASFTEFIGEKVAQQVPEIKISPVGALNLEGKREDGESSGPVSLDSLYSFCAANTENCAAAIEHYAKGVADLMRERLRPIEKSMIRLAIRSKEAIAQIQQENNTGGILLYAHPLTPDLAVVPLLDFTHSTKFFGNKELAKLGLTEDELFKIGEQNLRAMFKPLATVAKLPADKSPGAIAGEDYASSRIIFLSDWKKLSATLHHQLIVMVPDPEIVLFGDGSTPNGIATLRALGNHISRTSSYPLSTVILRWNKSGWEQVK